MKVKSIIIKCVTILVVVTLWCIVSQFVSPIVANEAALLQMSNSADSSLWIQIYSYLSNIVWVVLGAFAVLLFRRELVYIFKFSKSKIKEETNHEED